MKQMNTGKGGQKPGKQSGCERYQRIQWRCQLPTVEKAITQYLQPVCGSGGMKPMKSVDGLVQK